MKSFVFLFISSFALTTFAAHKQIPIKTCGENYQHLNCRVHDVTVDECSVDREKRCKLVRGTQYFMNVNFTPDFDGSDIEMLAFTNVGNIDAEFEGMDKNACNFMTCPVVNGVTQNYTFNVVVDRLKPRGSFTVQWRMKQNGQNKCCFENKFKIV